MSSEVLLADEQFIRKKRTKPEAVRTNRFTLRRDYRQRTYLYTDASVLKSLTSESCPGGAGGRVPANRTTSLSNNSSNDLCRFISTSRISNSIIWWL